MRKPVFEVSDKVQHKSSCTATKDGKRLEFLDFGSRDCTIYEVKTMALISCAVTAHLISIFVFAYEVRFSDDMAHITYFSFKAV